MPGSQQSWALQVSRYGHLDLSDQNPLTSSAMFSARHDHNQGQQGSRSCFQLTLDVSEITLRDSYLSTHDLSQLRPDQEEQHSVTEKLEKACRDAGVEIHVLLLGQYVDERRDRWDPGMTQDNDVVFGEKWNVGVLLCKPTAANIASARISDEGNWRRLGVIVWDLGNGSLSGRTVAEKEVLHGKGMLWKKQEGLFG